jgi:hypothetical protein
MRIALTRDFLLVYRNTCIGRGRITTDNENGVLTSGGGGMNTH